MRKRKILFNLFCANTILALEYKKTSFVFFLGGAEVGEHFLEERTLHVNNFPGQSKGGSLIQNWRCFLLFFFGGGMLFYSKF